ncbi:MAG: DUF1643 domain-containing protein [Rhizonema sp. PD38]|nr:DUF1643 domain-containing protein [Rhizonema sp. PD38]
MLAKMIRRCVDVLALLASWGYGSLEVVNLFAYRATKPRDMRSSDDPVGSENDHYIQSATKRASLIIVAWGQHGGFQNRNIEVLDLISVQPLYCLGLTKHGHPRHPLCIAKNTQPLLFCK